MVMARGGRWVLAGVIIGIGACVLQTETISGPKGCPRFGGATG